MTVFIDNICWNVNDSSLPAKEAVDVDELDVDDPTDEDELKRAVLDWLGYIYGEAAIDADFILG